MAKVVRPRDSEDEEQEYNYHDSCWKEITDRATGNGVPDKEIPIAHSWAWTEEMVRGGYWVSCARCGADIYGRRL